VPALAPLSTPHSTGRSRSSRSVVPSSSRRVRPWNPTTTIASHYSPHVRGLHASTLAHAVLPDEDEESVTPPSLSDDEVASTFLPLEFFDGGEMEPMTDDLWDKAESYFSKGKPFKARSKYYASGGKTSSMLPCEVVRYHPEEAKFEVQWVTQ
jgi:hypothetical protein